MPSLPYHDLIQIGERLLAPNLRACILVLRNILALKIRPPDSYRPNMRSISRMDTIKKTLQFVQVDDTELGQLVEIGVAS
jgi:hypothetical protein